MLMMLNLLHKLAVVYEVGIDVIMKPTRPKLVALLAAGTLKQKGKKKEIWCIPSHIVEVLEDVACVDWKDDGKWRNGVFCVKLNKLREYCIGGFTGPCCQDDFF